MPKGSQLYQTIGGRCYPDRGLQSAPSSSFRRQMLPSFGPNRHKPPPFGRRPFPYPGLDKVTCGLDRRPSTLLLQVAQIPLNGNSAGPLLRVREFFIFKDLGPSWERKNLHHILKSVHLFTLRQAKSTRSLNTRIRARVIALKSQQDPFPTPLIPSDPWFILTFPTRIQQDSKPAFFDLPSPQPQPMLQSQ